ncbi:TfoX/Sxy family protein [Parvibaculaceae bacterium PLY_AMNH_Bact1]|nr:TfoX/Sxy family protein [Parvibaculaceae bacterium PLY_AMNH_Bact1]
MAVSPEYKAFVMEVLEPLGDIRIRNMFGGAGVYYRDLMFGLIASETLHFKADDINRGGFENEGMTQFLYEAPPKDGKEGRKISMSYWEIPDRLFDEPDELVEWAKAAIEAATRNKKAKPKRGRTAKRKATAKKKIARKK